MKRKLPVAPQLAQISVLALGPVAVRHYNFRIFVKDFMPCKQPFILVDMTTMARGQLKKGRPLHSLINGNPNG